MVRSIVKNSAEAIGFDGPKTGGERASEGRWDPRLMLRNVRSDQNFGTANRDVHGGRWRGIYNRSGAVDSRTISLGLIFRWVGVSSRLSKNASASS